MEPVGAEWGQEQRMPGGGRVSCCVILGHDWCFPCVHSELKQELIGSCHMLGACEPLPATMRHLALLCRSAAQGIHQPTSSETNTKKPPCCQPGGTHCAAWACTSLGNREGAGRALEGELQGAGYASYWGRLGLE